MRTSIVQNWEHACGVAVRPFESRQAACAGQCRSGRGRVAERCLAGLGARLLDALVRKKGALFSEADVVVTMRVDLMLGAHRAGLRERIHGVLIGDRERAIAASLPTRKAARAHRSSFPAT